MTKRMIRKSEKAESNLMMRFAGKRILFVYFIILALSISFEEKTISALFVTSSKSSILPHLKHRVKTVSGNLTMVAF
jgi:hypothetical protein